MEESRRYIKIEYYEFMGLCRLGGRVDAVQEYVDEADYPEKDVILTILGIDMQKYNARMKKDQEAYAKALMEGESDTGSDNRSEG